MKRYISVILAFVLLLTCTFTDIPEVHAATKESVTRTIAIVFDNSGSMYIGGNLAWSRATYAMEVFASMLNPGDTLLIYPMNEIQVGGNKYTMENPYRITDAAQSSTIRQIGTTWPGPTPIESLDCAFQGIKQEKADEKYLIILSDGTYFTYFTEPPVVESEKKYGKYSPDDTKKELDKRIQANMGEDLTVMYLGMDTPSADGQGDKAIMPDTKETPYFVKRRAENSQQVLSVLTEMCNQIFGRDILPDSHVSGNKLNIDISLSQLIVFVQGENISDLKVVGPSGSKMVSESVRYADPLVGCLGRYVEQTKTDTSLQGMMVTYTDCAAGEYSIEYTGNATSVEVYYEPDADLQFVFTDSMGNTVDPNALYEGEYKVSYGMKDAQTGKLIESDLLGKPKYTGHIWVNGEEQKIESEGYSGEIPVTLNMNDSFKADLTVTYLSGYTIAKDSSDFGWPEDGIKVAARPAGELQLQISGGEELYSLQDLDEGAPYVAKVYYQGEQLTGKELESVALKWDPDTSNAEIKQEFAKDHYLLTLHYKNEEAPQDTVCGECTVSIQAFYTAKGSDEANTQASLTYNIDDDFSPLQMQLSAPEDYIVISKLDESQPITVDLRLDGAKLTEEEFASLKEPVVETGGIQYELIPDPQNSSYQLKLLSTDGLESGDYTVTVTAEHTDQIGRTTNVDETAVITLSKLPLWVKWLGFLLGLILLIILIWIIAHWRVLPKYTRHQVNECYMSVGGRNVTDGTDFAAKLSGRKLTVKVVYNGNTSGINLNNVEPGKDSYLSKPQKKRSILVKPENISMVGEITRAEIAGVSYSVNKNGKLVPDDEGQKPFKITNNAQVALDGKLEEGGKTKRFHADIPLTFKKK